MNLDDIVRDLQGAAPADRAMPDLEHDPDCSRSDPRLARIAELMLETPERDDQFSAFHRMSFLLPDGRHLAADAAPDDWANAAVAARVKVRMGYVFEPFFSAHAAERASATRERWAIWLDDPLYAAWKTDAPLLAPWKRVEGQLRIERPRNAGEPREHFVTSVAQVGISGNSYWAVICDGGGELCLHTEDLAELERTYERDRFSFGGQRIASPAKLPAHAIADVVVAARASRVEAFAATLLDAIDRAFATASTAPLLEALARPAVEGWWLVQSLIGKTATHERVVNESALAAIREHIEPTTLDVQIAPAELVGGDGLALVFARDDRRYVVFIDGYGVMACNDGTRQAASRVMPR